MTVSKRYRTVTYGFVESHFGFPWDLGRCKTISATILPSSFATSNRFRCSVFGLGFICGFKQVPFNKKRPAKWLGVVG